MKNDQQRYNSNLKGYPHEKDCFGVICRDGGVFALDAQVDLTWQTIKGRGELKSGFTASFIAYGNGVYLTASTGGYNIYYSVDDTATWNAIDVSKAFPKYQGGIRDIAYGDGRFVAVGGGGHTAYSDDSGLTWTAVNAANIFGTNVDESIFDITYGNECFVAVGGYGKIAYSSDGEMWAGVDLRAIFGENNIFDVAFGDEAFVAVSYEKIAYSSDGKTWQEGNTSVPGGGNSVAYGNGRFVVSGGIRALIYYSTDAGRTWIGADMSDILGSGGTVAGSVAYGGGIFVVGGINSTAYSLDGQTWIKGNQPLNYYQQIIYGRDRFVAIGNDGNIAFVVHPQRTMTRIEIDFMTKTENGTLGIVNYAGSAKDVIIPAVIKNIPVAAIGDLVFYGLQITAVTIPNSVMSIGEGAFWKNQLTNVIIPGSVAAIEDHTFYGNQLIRVNIPDSVISIGNSAFDNNQLTGIAIPDSVISIGNWAFAHNQLNDVSIGVSVASIGLAENQPGS